MSADGGTGVWDQIQWALTTVIGVISVGCGAVMTYIFGELNRIKEKQDKIISEALAHSGKGDESLWDALEGIRSRLDQLVAKDELVRLQAAIEEDRRLAANDRANIAVMMATKNELERQLDKQYTRLVEALGRRIPTERKGL